MIPFNQFSMIWIMGIRLLIAQILIVASLSFFTIEMPDQFLYLTYVLDLFENRSPSNPRKFKNSDPYYYYRMEYAISVRINRFFTFFTIRKQMEILHL